MRGLTFLLGILAIGAPAAGIAATAKKAPAPKTTVADDFKACRTEVTDARFAGCDRAIKSGRLNKQDLSLAYANRGTELLYKNDLAHAASDLDQAVKLDPNNQWAYITKVRLLLAKKDPTGALAAANAAIRVMATSYAYAMRGLALQALGRGEEAASDFNQALRLNHGRGRAADRAARAGGAGRGADRPRRRQEELLRPVGRRRDRGLRPRHRVGQIHRHRPGDAIFGPCLRVARQDGL